MESNQPTQAHIVPPKPIPWYLKKWFVVLMLIFFFPVGLVLCWLSPETKLVGRIIWSVLCGFVLLGMFSGGNSSSTAPTTAPSTASAPETQPAPAAQPAPTAATTTAPAPAPSKPAPAPSKPASAPAPAKKEPKWNTADKDIETNGNMAVAVSVLKDMTPDQLRQDADGSIPAATLLKQPWKYYGKPLKLQGQVGIADAFPADSDDGKAIGGEGAQIVMMADDGTLIDFFMIGDSGDVNVDNVATVYGYVTGQVDVANKMGGKTTQLMVVGKAIRKDR